MHFVITIYIVNKLQIQTFKFMFPNGALGFFLGILPTIDFDKVLDRHLFMCLWSLMW